MNRKNIGNIGENLVCEYLEGREFQIIERNYSTKYGEIDIVALRNGVLHFVEVKTRTSDKYGMPRDAVNAKKIDHLVRTARIYLSNRKIRGYDCSFDVAEVEIRYIENCI